MAGDAPNSSDEYTVGLRDICNYGNGDVLNAKSCSTFVKMMVRPSTVHFVLAGPLPVVNSKWLPRSPHRHRRRCRATIKARNRFLELRKSANRYAFHEYRSGQTRFLE